MSCCCLKEKQPAGLGEEVHGGSQQSKLDEKSQEKGASANCVSKVVFKAAGWGKANGMT